ncbi:hypothetical protein ACA910_012174 [Epithemia clementina (nom. ined.)]
MAKSGIDLCLSKLLLPPPTWYETAWSAIRGLASVAYNLEDRTALESMIQRGIIQDQVLQNSRHHSQLSPGGTGSVLTLALFDSLQHNPLWKKHGFDPAEFVEAVGPALTNFHDLVFQLQQEEAQKMEHRLKGIELEEEEEGEVIGRNYNRNKKINNVQGEDFLIKLMEKAIQQQQKQSVVNDDETKSQPNDKASSSSTSSSSVLAAASKNNWAKEAQENPDSLVAAVVKMATPTFLQYLYDSTMKEVLLRKKHTIPPPSLRNEALKGPNKHSSSNDDHDAESESVFSFSSTYIKGSVKIGQVAILRARAMEIDVNNYYDSDLPYEEFKASHPDFDKPKPVAAQIDVLFEISCKFRESFALSTLAGMLMNQHLGDSWNDDDEDDDDHDDSSTKPRKDNKDEIVQYTRLGVAVLEGWLYNNNNNNNKNKVGMENLNELRWRVPMLREPVEFFQGDADPTLRTVLDDHDIPEEAIRNNNKKKDSGGGNDDNNNNKTTKGDL